MGKKKGLTAKQALFVTEYLVDGNATQAAKRAKYSEKTAHRIGAENMQKPAIREAIDKALKRQEKRTEWTADKWVQSVGKLHEMCMSGDKLDSAGANRSLELLAKHYGYFEADNSRTLTHQYVMTDAPQEANGKANGHDELTKWQEQHGTEH